MISKLHERLGTAGFVIAIVALIAALTGTAFAAASLNGKQKKEVEQIAKKVAKPGKQGKQGPEGKQGPAGSNGSAGAKGDKGDPGTPGGAGQPGVSVTSTNANTAECPEGGTKFTSASGSSHVCNGAEGPPGPPGSPWVPNNVLPSKAMETGAYSITESSGTGPRVGVYAQTAISFTIPLPAAIEAAKAIWIKAGTTIPATCENSAHPGTASVTNPEASAGFLCVYEGNSQDFTEEKFIFVPDGTLLDEGAGVSGATLIREVEAAEAFDEGTWAVTAP